MARHLDSVEDGVLISGAVHGKLIGVFWLLFVVEVAKPVENVCCVHRLIPKSQI